MDILDIGAGVKKAGKYTDLRVSALENIGRFLSTWNCVTGKPVTDPSSALPYVYKTGDYYRISVIASSGGTNYKPSGTSYTGAASTATETEDLTTSDIYFFDGTNWVLQKAGGVRSVTVSAAGTSTNDVRYIDIDGVESRFASVALRAMKSAWKGSNLDTAQAATTILNDADVLEGDGFLGTVYWSNLPIPPGPGRQAEVKAFVLKKDTNHKIIQFECTSGTTAPYAWFFNSYEGEWRSYVPINDTLTSASTSEALSAKQGKTLADMIQNLTIRVEALEA